MTSAADALNVYRSYLGIREDPPHSNRTPIGERFGWNGVAWCAEDFSLGQHEAGNTSFQGSASCSVLVGRYEDGTNGEWLGNPGADGILPGDEFFLGAGGGDHTGCVEYVEGTIVHSLEGNWGDADVRVSRDVSHFYGFGRPRYDDQPAAPDLPPPSQTAGRPVLRQGNTGQWVSTLQTVLSGAGFATAVDGDFGPATAAALVSAQSAWGLSADGVCGPQTWAKIDAIIAYVSATQQTATPVDSIPEFPGTIRLGSHGAAVQAFQQRLADRRWAVTVDGIDGAGTTAILKQYQQEKGLTVDGIGGPQTWVSLWTEPIT
jgi:peptidoglycan hydrolase-like protein with peptidoglycan-binding domain